MKDDEAEPGLADEEPQLESSGLVDIPEPV